MPKISKESELFQADLSHDGTSGILLPERTPVKIGLNHVLFVGLVEGLAHVFARAFIDVVRLRRRDSELFGMGLKQAVDSLEKLLQVDGLVFQE